MAYIIATDDQLDAAAKIFSKGGVWQDPDDPRPKAEAEAALLAIVRSFLNSPVLDAMDLRRDVNQCHDEGTP